MGLRRTVLRAAGSSRRGGTLLASGRDGPSEASSAFGSAGPLGPAWARRWASGGWVSDSEGIWRSPMACSVSHKTWAPHGPSGRAPLTGRQRRSLWPQREPLGRFNRGRSPRVVKFLRNFTGGVAPSLRSLRDLRSGTTVVVPTPSCGTYGPTLRS